MPTIKAMERCGPELAKMIGLVRITRNTIQSLTFNTESARRAHLVNRTSTKLTAQSKWFTLQSSWSQKMRSSISAATRSSGLMSSSNQVNKIKFKHLYRLAIRSLRRPSLTISWAEANQQARMLSRSRDRRTGRRISYQAKVQILESRALLRASSTKAISNKYNRKFTSRPCRLGSTTTSTSKINLWEGAKGLIR